MLRLTTYLWKQVAGTFALAIAITTFVMLLGVFAKEDQLLELAAGGGNPGPAVTFLAYRLPEMLAYTVPVALLAATVLVFNRMSADNEITALRASGVSLLQVITPLVFLSLLLSGICYAAQFYYMPEFRYRSRAMLRRQAAGNPLALLEAGRYVELFPGYAVYVGERQENRVQDVHICVFRDGRIHQTVAARTGSLEVNETIREIRLRLDLATITTVAPDDPTSRHRLTTGSCEFPLRYGGALDRRRLSRKTGEMTVPQLFTRLRLYSEQGMPTTPLYMEIHMRTAIALAPFSFLLIGIPVGIRAARRETSIGLVICVAVAFGYYGLIAFVDALNDHPQLHPELLMWLPNILCQTTGLYALWLKR